MARIPVTSQTLSDSDLEFLVGEVAPNVSDPQRMMRAIRKNEDLRAAIVADDRVFERVVQDEEVLIRISAALYFEVLLRRASKDLESSAYTVERSGKQRIAVFDADSVSDLLAQPPVLYYLAGMMASFTRIHSQVTWVRVRRGLRRKIRRNDMDVDSLMKLCEDATETEKFPYYKRIADVCLFMTGVFPNHYDPGRWRLGPLAQNAVQLRRGQLGLDQYEELGRRFYTLAERHPASAMLDLSDVFATLAEHFTSAGKPLSHVAERYLHAGGARLFAAE